MPTWGNMMFYFGSGLSLLYGTEHFLNVFNTGWGWGWMLAIFILYNVAILFMDIIMRKILIKLWDVIWILGTYLGKLLFYYVVPFGILHFFFKWMEEDYWQYASWNDMNQTDVYYNIRDYLNGTLSVNISTILYKLKLV